MVSDCRGHRLLRLLVLLYHLLLRLFEPLSQCLMRSKDVILYQCFDDILFLLTDMCSKQTADNKCSGVYNNGVCDPECDNERHLYDGGDCGRAPPCDQEAYCATRFSDGVCDKLCNSARCLWDGGDCNTGRRHFANDTVVLTLARTEVTSTLNTKEMARSFSALFNTVVHVLPEGGRGRRRGKLRKGEQVPVEKDEKLYLKLDNTNCKNRCLRSADSAAKYLSMALTHGWKPGLPITTVTGMSRQGSLQLITSIPALL